MAPGARSPALALQGSLLLPTTLLQPLPGIWEEILWWFPPAGAPGLASAPVLPPPTDTQPRCSLQFHTAEELEVPGTDPLADAGPPGPGLRWPERAPPTLQEHWLPALQQNSVTHCSRCGPWSHGGTVQCQDAGCLPWALCPMQSYPSILHAKAWGVRRTVKCSFQFGCMFFTLDGWREWWKGALFAEGGRAGGRGYLGNKSVLCHLYECPGVMLEVSRVVCEIGECRWAGVQSAGREDQPEEHRALVIAGRGRGNYGTGR